MGYDPFWPASLATVNVLCVPAQYLIQSQFDEVFGSLKQVPQIELDSLESLGESAADQTDASRSPKCSILFNYSKSTSFGEIERFPCEPNARPQVVLGLLVVGHQTEQSERLSSDHAVTVESAYQIEQEFMSRYGALDNGCVCKLLRFNKNNEDNAVSEAILDIPDLNIASVHRALASVAKALITSLTAMSDGLRGKAIETPRSISLPTRGGSQRAASGRTEVAFRTLSQSGRPTDEHSTPATITAEEGEVMTRTWRNSIVLGTLKLQLGSWNNAMSLLKQGADEARQHRDLFWEFTAIERLLLCMFLLTWKGIDFMVPDVCDPSKSPLTLNPESRALTSLTISDLSATSQKSADGSLGLGQRFLRLSPSIVQMLLGINNHLVSTQSQEIPQILLTEARLRLLNLLIFLDHHKLNFGTKALEDFILQCKQAAPKSSYHMTRFSGSSQLNIAEMLIKTLPTMHEGLHSLNYTRTLVAIISALSCLGSSRKHAFYFRDLLQTLGPALIQARKLGASEVGVHPAAALSTTQSGKNDETSQILQGERMLLNAAVAAYGIPVPISFPRPGTRSANLEDVTASLDFWVTTQYSGDVFLKLEILRLCISLCDALPDLEASLYFTSRLLQSIKQVMTISTKSLNLPPMLSASEQIRLVESVKRTAAASVRLGLGDLRAEYWDHFLVRDITIPEFLLGSKLTPHTSKELSIVSDGMTDGMRDPFIFNPFAKPKSTGAAPVVVAGELITFSVLLQNSLEVDVDIDDIVILAEGCGFEPSHHSIVLGQLCSQVFSLTGKAHKSGELKINGCNAKIRGCYDQDFFIFRQDWQPPTRTKKSMGRGRTRASPNNGEGTFSASDRETKAPEPAIFTLKVIEPQPRVKVHKSTLIQQSLMLLEGEKKSFDLTLENESEKVPADFIHFTFDDNVVNGLQEVLSRKDVIPLDTYEIQYQLKFRPTMTMTKDCAVDAKLELLPRKNGVYTFDLFGKPGLTETTIQVNFACLGAKLSESLQTFYTRQTRFPIAVTVNGSVDIPRCNILPVSGDFAWASKQGDAANKLAASSNAESLISKVRFGTSQHGYCMLVLDLRNVWPQPLTVELVSRDMSDNEIKSTGQNEHVVQETLQPGHISRVILLVPRLFIADPYAPIPNLGSQRQFVVSTSKMSLEAEAASRELFWYREQLLKHLSGTWREERSGRHGDIDLRKGVRLSARMIDALKVDHVEISFSVKAFKGPHENAEEVEVVKQIGNSHFMLQTEAFATLSIRVHNRTKQQLHLLLRLQPSLRNQPHNIALDLSRRFAWSGVLQRALHPPIEPDGIFEAELGIVALAEGHYEVNATVEEIKARRRIASIPDIDFTAVKPERRIWHAHSPCLIDAFDGSS